MKLLHTLVNKTGFSTFAKSITNSKQCSLSSTAIYSRSIDFLVLLGLYKIHQNEDEPTHTQKYNLGPSSKKQTKQFDHGPIRPKKEICPFFGKNCWLEKTLRVYLTIKDTVI